jgi:hypothetical protein
MRLASLSPGLDRIKYAPLLRFSLRPVSDLFCRSFFRALPQALGVERHGISNTLGWAIVLFRYVRV